MTLSWPWPLRAPSGDWGVTLPGGASIGELTVWAKVALPEGTPPVDSSDTDAWSASCIVPNMTLVAGDTYAGIKLRLHRATSATAFWSSGTTATVFLYQGANTDTRYVLVCNEAFAGTSGAFLTTKTATAVWTSIDTYNGYWLLPVVTAAQPLPVQHPGSWPNLPTTFPGVGVNLTGAFTTGSFVGEATPDATDNPTGVGVHSPSGAFVFSPIPGQLPPFHFLGSTPYNITLE